jgi:hypothetical protein
MTDTSPFFEGYKVGFAGKKPHSNPHSPNTLEHEDWERGWMDGNEAHNRQVNLGITGPGALTREHSLSKK